jgi:BirA family biotin operon repressor/biotin-[acetyl-CoA-carboxylase] ligase
VPLQTIVHRFESLASTSVEALRLAEQGAVHGTVVTACRQSAGQGRGGRVFVSPPGGLYFSLILRPHLSPEVFPLITLAAGLGVHTTLSALDTGLTLRLKWPYDLYLAGRKLAGILVQSAPVHGGEPPGYFVVGVGINLNTDPALFPSSLRDSVVSLYHFSGTTYDRDAVLEQVVHTVIRSVDRLGVDRRALLDEWRAVDYLRGRTLTYEHHGKLLQAVGAGLADDGQYKVRDTKGTVHLVRAGDINPIRLAQN